MNTRNWIIVGVAVLLGLIAVYIGNAYFAGVQKREVEVAQKYKLSRIVVASQELAFGSPVTTQNVHLANWPSDSIPQGAFTSLDEATKNRVALRPIVVGEPILASKVSGENGRATLSANLPTGLLAFTVPISATAGVGGFVRPGDVVDVLLTRAMPGDNNSSGDQMTDVVLQAVPVLGIDQVADEKNTKPAVGHTATLQVSTLDAQKLALATHVGTLTLALRNVADQGTGVYRTVVPRDLTTSHIAMRSSGSGGSLARAPARRGAALPRAAWPQPKTGPSMTVIRGVNPTEYEVRRGY